MSKKILSILLSLVLVMAFMSACSKGDTTEGNATGNEAAGNETTATPAGENKLTEDSGTTITIAHNQGESYYESLYEMGDKFTELTGIKVEWMEIPSSDWDTWVQAQYAAGTELDIFTDKNTGAKMYTDAVLQLPAVKDVELPEELVALEEAEYGDDVPKYYTNAFKFTSEVSELYWEAYSIYLDPSSNQSAEDFTKDIKEQLMPYLDEAISEYTTFDVLSYVEQISE